MTRIAAAMLFVRLVDAMAGRIHAPTPYIVRGLKALPLSSSGCHETFRSFSPSRRDVRRRNVGGLSTNPRAAADGPVAHARHRSRVRRCEARDPEVLAAAGHASE